jgi:hypothetical protein
MLASGIAMNAPAHAGSRCADSSTDAMPRNVTVAATS